MANMHVVVDSLLTSYEVMGKGEVVVLLHGWGDRAAGLRGLQATLSDRRQVIAVDLPGFGGTQAPPEAWGLDEYAAFVGHFLEKIDAKPVQAFVGHSNGGAIAIRGIAQGSLQTDRLVLLASAGIRGEQKGKVGVLKMVAKAGKIASAPLPARAKNSLRRKLYQTAGSDFLVAEQLQETFKRIMQDDVRMDALKLHVPTLLVYGEQDMETPVRFGELFHELIADSTLEVLPGAGHFVHLDRPTEVVRAIEEFVR